MTLIFSRLFKLSENQTTGEWINKQISMCGDEICFNGLIGEYALNVLSFGEDDDGGPK